jgi:hypothetical protein
MSVEAKGWCILVIEVGSGERDCSLIDSRRMISNVLTGSAPRTMIYISTHHNGAWST